MDTLHDTKEQAAQYVVDSMPGMYTSAAALAQDPDAKAMLTEASATFQVIISNPDTRMALVESLVTSPLIDTIMVKQEELKNDPDAMNKFSSQLGAELNISLKS